MYTLYNVKGWGSMSIHFLLDEMQVAYDNKWMTPEQVRTPEFRKKSPLGLIPALGLADGKTLFETVGIITFLVTSHPESGLSPRPGTNEFGEFLSWLQLMNSNLYKEIGMTGHGNVYAKDAAHNEFIINAATERCHDLWGLLDRRLASSGPWMLGNQYSALDLYAFVAATWSSPSETAVLQKFPHVGKLASAIRARPRLKAALIAHGAMEPAS